MAMWEETLVTLRANIGAIELAASFGERWLLVGREAS